VETARLLLEAGADLEARSRFDRTPLVLACTNPCLPLIQLLFKRGANPNYVIFGRLRQELGQGVAAIEEQSKVLKFYNFIEYIKEATGSRIKEINPQNELETNRQALSAIFKYIDMDPSLLTGSIEADNENWLEIFHGKVNAFVPETFLKNYVERPMDEELDLMLFQNSDALKSWEVGDREAAFKKILAPHPQRGIRYINTNVSLYEVAVMYPIQHYVGFAVPNEAILESIARHGPIIEIGAGTGYWTATLQARGVDAIAYDAKPPDAAHNSNLFFHKTFTQVLEGDATSISFWCHNEQDLSKRTLLIVWPNDPEEHEIWDVHCLHRYMDAGGKMVTYVGEREENIKVKPHSSPDYGVSSSRCFQNLLKEHFNIAE
jgi:hypothetical protein